METWPNARRLQTQALAARRAALGNHHPATAQSLHCLAWLSAKNGDQDDAAEYLDEVRRAHRFYEARLLPTLSEREQIAFLARNHQPNWTASLAFGLACRSNQQIVARSAGWLVNGKSVAQEAVARAALLSGNATSSVVARLRTIREELARLAMVPTVEKTTERIQALQREQEQLVRELGLAGGTGERRDPWIEPDAVRQSLPPNSVMVNIAHFRLCNFETDSRGDAHYVAWLIPADSQKPIEIVDLGKSGPIDSTIDALRRMMNQADETTRTEDEQTATAAIGEVFETLSELLWKPLELHLHDVNELVLSPDGALWLVPWAALPLGDDECLLERFKIRYVISGRELASRNPHTSILSRPAVFANPDFDLVASSTGYAKQSGPGRRSITRLGSAERLPGTAREARDRSEPDPDWRRPTRPFFGSAGHGRAV